MIHPRLLSPLLALALCACTLPPMSSPTKNDPAPRASTGATTEGDAPASTSGTASVTQRLLPSGLIEIGSSDAPATLLLFTNHACAYCKTFARDLLPGLMEEYVRTNKLRITVAPFALQRYPQSERSARMQFCAAKQGKGMAMHDLLMNAAIDSQAWNAGLTAMSVDGAMLGACAESSESQAVIAAQQSFARSLGVTAVPTYFIDGDMFTGLPDRPDLRGQIEAALND